jgi:maleate isomerase
MMEEDMTNSTPETKDTRRSFFGHIGGAAVLGIASLAAKRIYAQTQVAATRPDGPDRLGGSAAADSSARSAEMRRAPDYEELLKKGYGHIGRVGYLSPGIIDETLSGQFYRMAPPGVTLVRTSLELKDVTIEEVNAALLRTEKAAAELGKYRPDCIVFGGSPTVAVPGHGSDKIIVEKIERASGRRAFAAQAAAIEALQKYGVKKLALATPFPDNVNALVKAFLEKSGFEILSIQGSGVDYVDLSLTPLQTSWELGKRVFEKARRADALYFPGAPQPCVDIIEPLEKELGTFVISSLQASLWKALQILKHQVPVEGYGRLLRDLG